MDVITIDNNFNDVIARPDQFPDEVVAAALEKVMEASKAIYEMKLRLQGHIIHQMQSENASKLPFIGADGKERLVTLKNGSMKCGKDADVAYKNAGFNPLEIGTYEFKPSWSKAKEARKVGGDKQVVIDDLFRADAPGITITEV